MKLDEVAVTNKSIEIKKGSGFVIGTILARTTAGTLFSNLNLWDRYSEDEVCQLGKVYSVGIPLTEFNVDIFKSLKLSDLDIRKLHYLFMRGFGYRSREDIENYLKLTDSQIEKLFVLCQYGVRFKSFDDVAKYIRFFDKFDEFDGFELSDIVFLRLIDLGYSLNVEDIRQFSLLSVGCKKEIRKIVGESGDSTGFRLMLSRLYWGMRSYCITNSSNVDTNKGNIGILKKVIIGFSRDIYSQIDGSCSSDVVHCFKKRMENVLSQICSLEEKSFESNVNFSDLRNECDKLHDSLMGLFGYIVEYDGKIHSLKSLIRNADNYVLKYDQLKTESLVMRQENSDFEVINYFYNRFSDMEKSGYCGEIGDYKVNYFC